MTLNSEKKKLERVITKALNNAITEIDLCGDLFSEEALRYLVMNELSIENIWGNFPNTLGRKKLVFEYAYPKFRGKDKKGTFRPDIASLNLKSNGEVSDLNPLAIELKVTDWVTKDIQKCRDYLNPLKGKKQFNLTAVIIAPLPKKRSLAIYRTNERKRLQKQKKNTGNEELRILFAWINPETNSPELFWIS